MLEECLALIEKYRMLPRGATVLCAVSGGADSVCLLHLLYRLRPRLGFQLAAAHYNHRLRGEESERDQRFVEEFVSLCCGPDRVRNPDGSVVLLPAVPLLVGGGDVAARAARDRRGLEETAREMRYAFLRQAARQTGAEVIATAHNADDNAETLLLHLMRGCGLRGLTGISPSRNGLVRPLLTTTRAQIEEYLAYHGLPHVEDSSNRSDAYTRNRIRHQVMPQLESVCPGFARRLTATAQLLEADEAYLQQLAEQTAAQAHLEGGRLTVSADALAQLPQPLAVRAVRKLIGQMTQGNDNCAAAHLEGVAALCRGEDPSAQIHLPNGLTARREYGLLVLSREGEQAPASPVPLPLPGETEFGAWHILCQEEVYEGQPHTACDFFLRREGGEPPLFLRTRETGDTLAPPGRRRKSIKKWMIEEKIPARLRACLPVIDSRGRAAAAAGLGPDRDFVPRAGEKSWHITILHQTVRFHQRTDG